MVEEISEYYRKKGYTKLYVNTNKEPRRVATLRKDNGEMTSMSYAKYLYTSQYECEVAEGYQVDHIDGNKMNDTIENLQVLSKNLNNVKDRPRKEMVMFKCPVCGTEFLIDKRNVPFRGDNPCCSRRCGGIKASWSWKKKVEGN